MRVVESAAGTSSSRNVDIAGGTADSVVAAEETTKGFQITKVVNRIHKLADRWRFAP